MQKKKTAILEVKSYIEIEYNPWMLLAILCDMASLLFSGEVRKCLNRTQYWKQ